MNYWFRYGSIFIFWCHGSLTWQLKMYGCLFISTHNSDVAMGAMVSHITSVSSAYSTVHSGVDQRKHQSIALLAFVRGIHRWPVNFPHKGQVTRKMFPFDDVIMKCRRNISEIRLHAIKLHLTVINYQIDWCVTLSRYYSYDINFQYTRRGNAMALASEMSWPSPNLSRRIC